MPARELFHWLMSPCPISINTGRKDTLHVFSLVCSISVGRTMFSLLQAAIIRMAAMQMLFEKFILFSFKFIP
nr:MAG TPA: hypothetical protein [Caudoviricetes sp.]